MTFNKHSNLSGQHAFLGASKYAWLNYDEEKVADTYTNFLAAKKEPYYMTSQHAALHSDKSCQGLEKH